jgi:hypothetical protein
LTAVNHCRKLPEKIEASWQTFGGERVAFPHGCTLRLEKNIKLFVSFGIKTNLGGEWYAKR